MPNKPKIISLSLDELLRDSGRQMTSMSLPLAVHHRLDLLAEKTEATKASRGEIIGMLIAEAKLDAEKLDEKVLAYRRMTVRDVVPDEPDEPDRAGEHDNVIRFERRGPGRPRREAS